MTFWLHLRAFNFILGFSAADRALERLFGKTRNGVPTTSGAPDLIFQPGAGLAQRPPRNCSPSRPAFRPNGGNTVIARASFPAGVVPTVGKASSVRNLSSPRWGRRVEAVLEGVAAGITLEIFAQAVNGGSQSVASNPILVTMPVTEGKPEAPAAPTTEVSPLAAIAPNGNGSANGNGNGTTNGNGSRRSARVS